MKIEMKLGRKPNSKAPAGSDLVWWWQITEGDERVGDGVGWQWSKEDAYGDAMKFMREERARRARGVPETITSDALN